MRMTGMGPVIMMVMMVPVRVRSAIHMAHAHPNAVMMTVLIRQPVQTLPDERNAAVCGQKA